MGIALPGDSARARAQQLDPDPPLLRSGQDDGHGDGPGDECHDHPRLAPLPAPDIPAEADARRHLREQRERPRARPAERENHGQCDEHVDIPVREVDPNRWKQHEGEAPSAADGDEGRHLKSEPHVDGYLPRDQVDRRDDEGRRWRIPERGTTAQRAVAGNPEWLGRVDEPVRERVEAMKARVKDDPGNSQTAERGEAEPDRLPPATQ